ncbi:MULTISPECIES: glycosyltransferase family 2 protein [unclassified Halanaerobium]|uniref:glycosyltransferase family 2 protein n=1 Tax=unclassified Halanaerobium TaxID=2641197 RepID=UPI000DF2E1FC|nr:MULTISPECIES: glycosyltransferase family 2 protein [unclassified Halanaerobium]RCW45005.1 glycosyltransferase involved in cell wall biosynthesis [Halanaerobium sp. MA284_MarDTE_T2]RCW83284.1 glycosyltransferase involved in cell wall biosynthesis [Halanaerobium sp. DL-01]
MKEFRYDLSIVVPIFNEIDNLDLLTNRIIEVLYDREFNYQIIYVDDGSTDGSSEKINNLSKKIDNLFSIHFIENTGQSAAFFAGFEKAEGKYIVTLDADLQVDPEDMFKLIPHLDKYDIVIGMRSDRNDGFKKKISSLIGNGVRNFITGEEVADTGCPLKVFKNEVSRCFYPFEGMHRFYPTLAKINGYKVKEIPVSHYPRKYGNSKYGIKNRIWKGLLDTFAVLWMKKRIINYRIREE